MIFDPQTSYIFTIFINHKSKKGSPGIFYKSMLSIYKYDSDIYKLIYFDIR